MSISAWLPRVPPLFKLTHTAFRFNEDSRTLLPTDGSMYPKGGRWISWPQKLKRLRWYILVALAAVCGLLWVTFSFFTRGVWLSPSSWPKLMAYNA